jgi:hypothetical protein
MSDKYLPHIYKNPWPSLERSSHCRRIGVETSNWPRRRRRPCGIPQSHSKVGRALDIDSSTQSLQRLALYSLLDRSRRLLAWDSSTWSSTRVCGNVVFLPTACAKMKVRTILASRCQNLEHVSGLGKAECAQKVIVICSHFRPDVTYSPSQSFV